MKLTKTLQIFIVFIMAIYYVSCQNNFTETENQNNSQLGEEKNNKIHKWSLKDELVDKERDEYFKKHGKIWHARGEWDEDTDKETAEFLGLTVKEIREARNSFPLPNYDVTSPYFNFYMTDKRHPSYLLCRYTVNKVNYDRFMEKHWFKASLEQIRNLGHEKFPPDTQYIAVVISNIAEHQGLSTFEKSHKVGAIFNADSIFNHSKDLTELIRNVKKNRHPIMYDSSKRTPGEQERWLIVEQHAANIEKLIKSENEKNKEQPEKK